uniref:Uncharacterized protein n=1 Tax=viral metagenome TaxID=1070528 RepID=A0A6C0AE37_9ZZZZ
MNRNFIKIISKTNKNLLNEISQKYVYINKIKPEVKYEIFIDDFSCDNFEKSLQNNHKIWFRLLDFKSKDLFSYYMTILEDNLKIKNSSSISFYQHGIYILTVNILNNKNENHITIFTKNHGDSFLDEFLKYAKFNVFFYSFLISTTFYLII